MKKKQKKMPENPKSLLFSAGVDYFSISNDSLWGSGEPETLELLEKINVSGNWLDLAAGDGRYATILSEKVNSLFATDADPGALSKLFFRVDGVYRKKIHFTQLNMKNPLPFLGASFDGVICTGTLHLFDSVVLTNILLEILRVLKDSGTLIIDFAVDIKRNYPDGKIFTHNGDMGYTSQTANLLLQQIFGKNLDNIWISSFEDDLTNVVGYGYITQGNFLLICASKKRG